MTQSFGKRSLVGVFVLTLVLGAPASGQSVHVVAGDGTGDFVQLQAAVDAAAGGDVILVRPHTQRYAATTIDGKALTIVGDGDVRPEVEDMRVVNLAADEAATLRFLDLKGRFENQIFLFVFHVGLELSGNEGCVWLEDLVIVGADGVLSFGEEGADGLDVRDSGCVVFVDSTITGGMGTSAISPIGRPGGRGAVLVDSTAAFHGCTVSGGKGGEGFGGSAGSGGLGIDSSASTLFASGSIVAGGDTGDDIARVAEPSASGLLARDASTVDHLATTFAAGGGPAPVGDAITIEAGSAVTDLDDDHRAIEMPAVLREAEVAQVSYAGAPGDQVLLLLAAEPAWQFVPARKGVLHLGSMIVSAFLGVAGPTGALDLAFGTPSLPTGVDAVAAFAQPFVAETDGSRRLGAPSSILIVDDSIPAP